MNFLSPIIRILVGLFLIIAAAIKYFDIRGRLAEGEAESVQMLGFTITAESWQLPLIFGIAVLIGLLLLALGAANLFRKIQEA